MRSAVIREREAVPRENGHKREAVSYTRRDGIRQKRLQGSEKIGYKRERRFQERSGCKGEAVTRETRL